MTKQEKMTEFAQYIADNNINYKELANELNKAVVDAALVKTYGNQTQAAINLGINRQSLRKYRSQ